MDIFTGALVYIDQRLPPRVRQTSGGYCLVAIAATDTNFPSKRTLFLRKDDSKDTNENESSEDDE